MEKARQHSSLTCLESPLDAHHPHLLTAAVVLSIGCFMSPVVAQEITTPSGQSVSLFDVVLEPDEDTARFRFLAPAIGPAEGGRPFEEVQVDFPWLCDLVALPALATNDWQVGHVVISMSEREVAFGTTDPDVVQFFEGFRIESGACILEIF
jgi:hypothetical protein